MSTNNTEVQRLDQKKEVVNDMAETMENSKEKSFKKVKSLEDGASILSFLFILFMDSLFAKGYSEGIKHDDLGVVSEQDEARGLYLRFDKFLNEEVANKQGPRRSLWLVLWHSVVVSNKSRPLLIFPL